MNFRTESSSFPKPIFFLSRYKFCLTEVSLTHMILAKMLVEKLKRNKMSNSLSRSDSCGNPFESLAKKSGSSGKSSDRVCAVANTSC